MRRLLTMLALVALATALTAPGATAAGEPATVAKLKGCHVKDSFMTGPFFAWRVRKRGMTCRAARTQAKKWGDTRPCVYTDGPNDHTCQRRRLPLRHPQCRVRGWPHPLRTQGQRRQLALELLAGYGPASIARSTSAGSG